jgi:hypothetical protein
VGYKWVMTNVRMTHSKFEEKIMIFYQYREPFVIGEDSEQIHIKVVANFLISFGAHINI